MPHISAFAHQCHSCRRHWALKFIDHPAGKVALCRYCRAVRATSVNRRAPAASSR